MPGNRQRSEPPAAGGSEPAAEEVLEARRRARRSRRRERSREEILQAARGVLLRTGIGGATLEAVAQEAGMSKAALYYYFPSKDALLFELVFASVQAHAQQVRDAVAATRDGTAALRALIATLVQGYARELDDFRLDFLHGQVAGPGSVQVDAEQFARIRPLNDLMLAGATGKLAQAGRNRAGLDPRLLAFLAQLSAVGLLTMKGMVENVDDPLLYSDAQLIDGLAAVFAAAAEPVEEA